MHLNARKTPSNVSLNSRYEFAKIEPWSVAWLSLAIALIHTFSSSAVRRGFTSKGALPASAKATLSSSISFRSNSMTASLSPTTFLSPRAVSWVQMELQLLYQTLLFGGKDVPLNAAMGLRELTTYCAWVFSVYRSVAYGFCMMRAAPVTVGCSKCAKSSWSRSILCMEICMSVFIARVFPPWTIFVGHTRLFWRFICAMLCCVAGRIGPFDQA